MRSLRRTRLGQEDEVIAAKKPAMARAWADFADYLADLAVRHERHCSGLISQQTAIGGEGPIGS